MYAFRRRSHPLFLLLMIAFGFGVLSLVFETIQTRNDAFLVTDPLTSQYLHSRADDNQVLTQFALISLVCLVSLYLIDVYRDIRSQVKIRMTEIALLIASTTTTGFLYTLALVWEGSPYTLRDDIFLTKTFPFLSQITTILVAAFFVCCIVAVERIRHVPLYYILKTEKELEQLAVERRKELLRRAASIARMRGRPDEITAEDVRDAEKDMESEVA